MQRESQVLDFSARIASEFADVAKALSPTGKHSSIALSDVLLVVEAFDEAHDLSSRHFVALINGTGAHGRHKALSDFARLSVTSAGPVQDPFIDVQLSHARGPCLHLEGSFPSVLQSACAGPLEIIGCEHLAAELLRGGDEAGWSVQVAIRRLSYELVEGCFDQYLLRGVDTGFATRKLSVGDVRARPPPPGPPPLPPPADPDDEFDMLADQESVLGNAVPSIGGRGGDHVDACDGGQVVGEWGMLVADLASVLELDGGADELRDFQSMGEDMAAFEEGLRVEADVQSDEAPGGTFGGPLGSVLSKTHVSVSFSDKPVPSWRRLSGIVQLAGVSRVRHLAHCRG